MKYNEFMPMNIGHWTSLNSWLLGKGDVYTSHFYTIVPFITSCITTLPTAMLFIVYQLCHGLSNQSLCFSSDFSNRMESPLSEVVLYLFLMF